MKLKLLKKLKKFESESHQISTNQIPIKVRPFGGWCGGQVGSVVVEADKEDEFENEVEEFEVEVDEVEVKVEVKAEAEVVE